LILPIANVLQPLIDIAEAVLVFFHDAGLGWGAAIIGLTFVTRLAILPLSIKQIRSMRALQAYAPQIKEIQEKYKDDRQRQQREMMAFYQENKINPFASCVPLLLQIPVFLALFYALQDDLRQQICGQTDDPCGDIASSAGERFLFIPDLTDAATGGVLLALILLFIGTQLAAGSVMMATADRNQRLLMFALPLIIVPFIISFPAGLVVYWIATNVWTIGQQFLVKKVAPPPEKPTPEAIKAAKPPPPPPRKRKRRRR
jgi:YidC/Oxa1 family membrane protein insertase